MSFFYDDRQTSWGFDPKDRTSFLVLFAHSTENLQRREHLNSESASTLMNTVKRLLSRRSPECPVFKPLALKFVAFLSIPDPSAESIYHLLPDSDDGTDPYAEFFDSYCRVGPMHQLLGLPAPIQNEMELECQLVTNGLYTGDGSGYKNPRRAELEKSKSDWILLFQLDSDNDAEMMWGDAGTLYFWIRKQDLAAARFDKAWCILQCH